MLSYEPELDLIVDSKASIDIITLGRAAVEEFEGTESALLDHLINAGRAGGEPQNERYTFVAWEMIAAFICFVGIDMSLFGSLGDMLS